MEYNSLPQGQKNEPRFRSRWFYLRYRWLHHFRPCKVGVGIMMTYKWLHIPTRTSGIKSITSAEVFNLCRFAGLTYNNFKKNHELELYRMWNASSNDWMYGPVDCE